MNLVNWQGPKQDWDPAQLYAQIIVPLYDLEWERQTSLRKDYNEIEWVLSRCVRCFQWTCGLSVLTGISGGTDDLHYQHEYVFCMPFHALLLPFSHLFHCLPCSSFITELPEYQIITKSAANINRFFCLQWNYANFHQPKILFLLTDLFYNHISYF